MFIFILGACSLADIALVSGGDPSPFNDPVVETGGETADTGDVIDTGGNAEVCDVPVAIPIFLDPGRELVSCLPNEDWSLGTVQGIEPGGGENTFFAAAALGDLTPGDGIVHGGESEVEMIGAEDPSSASEILARARDSDLESGFVVSPILPFAIGEWMGGVYQASVPSGVSDQFPDGASMTRSTVQVDESRTLLVLASYGQWSADPSQLLGLQKAWGVVENADVEDAQ